MCKCLRCEREWESKVETPAACRWCKSPYWNKAKVRKPGGGRKAGLGWKVGEVKDVAGVPMVRYPDMVAGKDGVMREEGKKISEGGGVVKRRKKVGDEVVGRELVPFEDC